MQRTKCLHVCLHIDWNPYGTFKPCSIGMYCLKQQELLALYFVMVKDAIGYFMEIRVFRKDLKYFQQNECIHKAFVTRHHILFQSHLLPNRKEFIALYVVSGTRHLFSRYAYCSKG